MKDTGLFQVFLINHPQGSPTANVNHAISVAAKYAEVTRDVSVRRVFESGKKTKIVAQWRGGERTT